MVRKLNLGCGRNPRQGYVNVDIRPGPGVDLLLDLDESDSLLSFGTGSIDEVLALGLLEHLPHWESLVLEIARVLRPNGRFQVRVPYKTDYVAYHIRHFDRNTFNPFRSDVKYVHDDLVFRAKEKWGSLEFREPYFTLQRRWVQHFVPFAWHIQKYVGIDVTPLPLGKRLNLVFDLRRNGLAWKA